MRKFPEIVKILSIFTISSVLLILIQSLFVIFDPNLSENSAYQYTLLTILNTFWYVSMAVLFYLAIKSALKLEFKHFKEMAKNERRVFIIRGLLTMYVVQILVTLLLDSLGLFEVSNNQEAILSLVEVGPFTQILLVIFAVFLAPFTEEILFRRTLFKWLKKMSTPLLAVLLSSILFGLIHGLTELNNPIVLLPYIGVGIVLQVFYIKSGSLIVPMIMHASFNLIGVIFILIATYVPIFPA